MDETVSLLQLSIGDPAVDDLIHAVDEPSIETVGVTTVDECLHHLSENETDCVLLVSDPNHPELEEAITRIRKRFSWVPLVCVTEADSKSMSAALRAGATEIVPENRLDGGSPELLAKVRASVDRHVVDRDYRRLFDLLPDGVTLHNAHDGTILEANRQFCDLLGYERSEMLSLDFTELHPDEEPYTSERARTYIEKAATEGPQTFEWVDVTKGGDRVPVEVHLRHLELNGDPRILAVVRDISERRDRTRRLEQYETVVETMPLGVMVIDETDVIIETNDEVARTLGLPQRDLPGTMLSALVAEDLIDEEAVARYEEAVRTLRSSASRDETEIFEFELTWPAGDRRVVEAHIGLRPSDDGFAGTVVVFRDVTDRLNQQRELERQNARLEQFASVVSHDLQSPISIAEGRIDLARETGDMEHLEKAQWAIDRMKALIDDTLELARQGDTIGDRESVSLEAVARSSWAGVSPAGATLEVVDDLVMHGDRDRLSRVFVNLFQNSIEHGGRDVTISIGPIDSSGFYVEDDGTGIQLDARTQVFEPGRSTSEDGTGFGLAIVKEIIEAHGWSIDVSDSAAGGARFEITDVDVDPQN